MAMKAIERFADARGAKEGKIVAVVLTALLAFTTFTPTTLAVADEVDDAEDVSLTVNDLPQPAPESPEGDAAVPGTEEGGAPEADAIDPMEEGDLSATEDDLGDADGAAIPEGPAGESLAATELEAEANDGALVHVTAAEGFVFPEGASLRAETALTDKVTGALEASLKPGQRLGTVRAYQIEIVDGEGNPLADAVPCVVSLELAGVPAFDVTVFRMLGDGKVLKIDEPAGLVPDLVGLSFKTDVASAVYALAMVESAPQAAEPVAEEPVSQVEGTVEGDEPSDAEGANAQPAAPKAPAAPAEPTDPTEDAAEPEQATETQTLVMYVGEERSVLCKNVQGSHGWLSDDPSCVDVKNINAAQGTIVAKAPGRTTVHCDQDATYEVTVKPLPKTQELTYFYFLPPTADGTATDISQAKYMGSGLATVPAGYVPQSSLVNGTVLPAVTEGAETVGERVVNLRDMIAEYPSDAEVRQGLAAYFKGTIDASASGASSMKYDDSWNYSFEPVLFKGKMNSLGCDGTALAPQSAYHMYVQLKIDVPEQHYTVAYEVRTPSGTEHRSVLHGMTDPAIDLNGYSASATSITVDGVAYPAVKTDGEKVTYHFDGWYTDHTFMTKAPQTYGEQASATFYARYLSVDAKTVTFDPADGIFPDGSVDAKTHRANAGEAYTLLEAPTRYGYQFQGWRRDNGAALHDPGSARKMEDSDVTYTAVWKAEEATISFDAGEGKLVGSTTLTGTTGQALDQEQLPVPVRPGYKLVGWYDNEHFAGSAIDRLPSTFPAGNTVYYAKYEIDPSQRYTVTYRAAANTGGYVTRDLVSYGFGAVITDECIVGMGLEGVKGAKAVWLPGWRFDGWYKIDVRGNPVRVPTESSVDISAAEAQDNLNKNGAGAYVDTVYEARFVQDILDENNVRTYGVEYFLMDDEGRYPAEPQYRTEHTGVVNDAVRFTEAMLNSDLSAAEVNDYVVDTAAEGAMTESFLLSAEEQPEAPVLKVYLQKRLAVVFDEGAHGHFDTARLDGAPELVDEGRLVRYRALKGEAMPTAPIVLPESGYAFAGWAEGEVSVAELAPTVSRAVTYTAQYEAEDAILQFNANGGSAIEPVVGKTGDSLAGMELPTPTREGYRFVGWFDGNEQVMALPEVLPAGHTVYRAEWEAEDAYITFNNNAPDATGAVVGTQGKTDQPVTAPFPTTVNLERPGYLFAGWNTQADGTGMAVTEFPAAFPAGTTTYYAQWKLDTTGLTGESFSYQGTYDGRAHRLGLPEGFQLKEGEALAVKVDGAWVTNPQLVPTYKHVGDSATGIEVAILDRTGAVLFETNEVSVAIAPAELMVTTGSIIHPFDGTVATCDQIAVTGLRAGETLGARTTGAASQVGEEVTNDFRLTWAEDDDRYTAKRSDYTVSAQRGTVKVVTTTCPVTIEGYVGIYDGAEHAVSADSPEATITFDGDTAYTEAGDYAVPYTVTCPDHGTFTGTVSVTILPRPITIAVEDSYKLASSADPVFRGAIVAGELVKADDLGAITFARSFEGDAVGVYEEGLTAVYTPNDNYAVTVLRGTFTIGPDDEEGTVNQYPLVTPGSHGPSAPTPGGGTPLARTTPSSVSTITSYTEARRQLAAAQPAAVGDLPAPVYMDVIGDDNVPMIRRVGAEVINDDGTALGAFDEPHCWVHWVMALGILLTVGYAAAVVRRRLGFARRAARFDDDLTGGQAVQETAASQAQRLRV